LEQCLGFANPGKTWSNELGLRISPSLPKSDHVTNESGTEDENPVLADWMRPSIGSAESMKLSAEAS